MAVRQTFRPKPPVHIVLPAPLYPRGLPPTPSPTPDSGVLTEASYGLAKTAGRSMLVSPSSAQSTIPTYVHEQKDTPEGSCCSRQEIKMPGSLCEQTLTPLTVKCERLAQHVQASLHSPTFYHVTGPQQCTHFWETIKPRTNRGFLEDLLEDPVFKDGW